MNAEVDALVATWRKDGDIADAAQQWSRAGTLWSCANELEALAARPAAPPVDTTLENISAVARRALSFGHQATPQTPERMIERKDDALRRIHELTGVSGSVLRAAPPVGESERLREALEAMRAEHDAIREVLGLMAGGTGLSLAEEVRRALASPAPQPACDGTVAAGMATEHAKIRAAAPAPVEPPPAETVEIVRQVMADEARRLAGGGIEADPFPYRLRGVEHITTCAICGGDRRRCVHRHPEHPAPVETPPQVVGRLLSRLSGGGILSRAEIQEPAPRPSMATGRAKLIEDARKSQE